MTSTGSDKPKFHYVTLEEILVDFSGAQLILLKRGDRDVIGVAIEEYKQFKNPFFCCAAKEASLEKYFEGRADLSYVFETAYSGKYYFYDMDSEGKQKLFLATKTEAGNRSEYWPEDGFFVRSHTSNYRLDNFNTSTQKFHIDGYWGPRDFATFNTKVSDLYALFDIADDKDDKIRNANFRQSISHRDYQGGGSYLGVYKDMRNSGNRLRMKEIQYASPGHISLSGNPRALSQISTIIDLFDEQFSEINEKAKLLYKLLTEEDLLGKPKDASFSNEAQEKMAETYATDLYNSMGLTESNWLLDRCSSNKLVYSKIVRSIYSRAKALWEYRREGRLKDIH